METLEITGGNPNENETLVEVFSCEFSEIFKNSFFSEHLRLTASDIKKQVVVIYNLSLSLQFVKINFTLFCEFSRHCMVHITRICTSICFSVGLFLSMIARQLPKKNNNKV